MIQTVPMDGKWEARFMGLAKEISKWSKDPTTQVGAVVVRPDKTIASVGFNGFPRGVNDSPFRQDDREQKLLFTVHAELNAILSAKERLDACSIFVWPFQPCAHCAAAIIQSGICTVYCPIPIHNENWRQSFKAADQMFVESGIKVYYA